jgi:hypothetical protein
VRVVGEIAIVVNALYGRPGIRAKSPIERAPGFLPRQIENEIGGRDKAGGVPGEDRLMEEILGDHGLPQALGGQPNHILALGHTLKRQDAFDAGAMDLFGHQAHSKSAIGLNRPIRGIRFQF